MGDQQICNSDIVYVVYVWELGQGQSVWTFRDDSAEISNNLISDFEKKRKELPESKLYLTAPNSIEFDPIEHIASNL
jgi:hypothetical protein